MQTGGTTYYYVTNLQGDVVALLDASGNTVASYAYNPYGKILSAEGTMAETNPLRYRGYYYDNESGLYYLQSRYYDPAVCRFVNADGYASTGQGVLGYNMFAYCNNSPIIASDPDGEWLNVVVGMVVGAAVNCGIAIAEGKSAGGVIMATVCGLVSGGGAAMGLGAITGMATSFINATYDNIKKVKDGTASIGEAIVDTVVNTAMGAAFGAMGSSSPVDRLISKQVSDAGRNGVRVLLKQKVIHPVVKKAAKKAVKEAGRYIAKTVTSEFVSGIISNGITRGSTTLARKMYSGYVAMYK